MRSRVEPRRFVHIMGVELMALALGERAGLARDRVCAAALLHDFCKDVDEEDLIEALREARVFRPSAEDWKYPSMWHALAAAECAPGRFGVEDREVLEAVAWHTTGNAPVGKVALALYVADYIEPTRSFPGVEELRRELLSMPLEDAARTAATHKIEQISRKGKALHSRTRRMADWLGGRAADPNQGADPAS
ncbi:MAG: bis(5'-nucleosyl)-tetraphosphatase (symmetrical) YqeK [Candidatus Sumerlaeia bacterium]|nr:bis(5'-nucleosyl)-tetraphosphatase (symmetrical) YqeK [Candidatus Sumerlaeia bacterium]